MKNHAFIMLIALITIFSFNEAKAQNNCPQNPPCYGNSCDRYKVTAYSGTCKAACYTQFPISDPNIQMLVTYHNCVNEYCCRRILKFCTRSDGSLQMEEEIQKDINPECSNYTYPSPLCPPGQNVNVSACIDYCDED